MTRRNGTAPHPPVDTDENLDSLVSEAERIFADDLVAPDGSTDGLDWEDAPVIENHTEPPASPAPPAWRPGRDKMIKVRGGGDYLGVRYRLLWMRKDHPDWATRVEPYLLDWEGGIAIFWGRIFDGDGRLIAEDMKTETRKDFPDFVEKAATGALGRALAGAGYGTEGALELDEGVSAQTGDLRIADAPVRNGSGPISITPSNVPGIKQGGRSQHITTAQLQALARRSKELDLGPAGLAEILGEESLIDAIAGTTDPHEQQVLLLAHLKTFSFDDAAALLQQLTDDAA